MLPGGHQPPVRANGQNLLPCQFTFDLVAAVTPLPVPTQGAEHAVRIMILALCRCTRCRRRRLGVAEEGRRSPPR